MPHTHAERISLEPCIAMLPTLRALCEQTAASWLVLTHDGTIHTSTREFEQERAPLTILHAELDAYEGGGYWSGWSFDLHPGPVGPVVMIERVQRGELRWADRRLAAQVLAGLEEGQSGLIIGPPDAPLQSYLSHIATMPHMEEQVIALVGDLPLEGREGPVIALEAGRTAEQRARLERLLATQRVVLWSELRGALDARGLFGVPGAPWRWATLASWESSQALDAALSWLDPFQPGFALHQLLFVAEDGEGEHVVSGLLLGEDGQWRSFGTPPPGALERVTLRLMPPRTATSLSPAVTSMPDHAPVARGVATPVDPAPSLPPQPLTTSLEDAEEPGVVPDVQPLDDDISPPTEQPAAHISGEFFPPVDVRSSGVFAAPNARTASGEHEAVELATESEVLRFQDGEEEKVRAQISAPLADSPEESTDAEEAAEPAPQATSPAADVRSSSAFARIDALASELDAWSDVDDDELLGEPSPAPAAAPTPEPPSAPSLEVHDTFTRRPSRPRIEYPPVEERQAPMHQFSEPMFAAAPTDEKQRSSIIIGTSEAQSAGYDEDEDDGSADETMVISAAAMGFMMHGDSDSATSGDEAPDALDEAAASPVSAKLPDTDERPRPDREKALGLLNSLDIDSLYESDVEDEEDATEDAVDGAFSEPVEPAGHEEVSTVEELFEDSDVPAPEELPELAAAEDVFSSALTPPEDPQASLERPDTSPHPALQRPLSSSPALPPLSVPDEATAIPSEASSPYTIEGMPFAQEEEPSQGSAQGESLAAFLSISEIEVDEQAAAEAMAATGEPAQMTHAPAPEQEDETAEYSLSDLRDTAEFEMTPEEIAAARASKLPSPASGPVPTLSNPLFSRPPSPSPNTPQPTDAATSVLSGDVLSGLQFQSFAGATEEPEQQPKHDAATSVLTQDALGHLKFDDFFGGSDEQAFSTSGTPIALDPTPSFIDHYGEDVEEEDEQELSDKLRAWRSRKRKERTHGETSNTGVLSQVARPKSNAPSTNEDPPDMPDFSDLFEF